MAQFSKDYFDKHRTYSYVTRPPEAFDAGRYMGIEKPGFIGSVLDNVAGGVAGMVGGLADTTGTFLKSGYEEGQLDELWGLLGKGLVDAGIDLNQYAGEKAARSGVLGKYEDMGLLDRATSLDYWTDPRGFTAESANAFGSMIPFMALAAAAPEVGASAGLSYLARAGLSRVGLKKAAELFSPRVAAMIGGNKVATPGGAGREFLADFANWAGTGVFDAAANAGEVIAEARRKGETDTEMAERAKKAMYYELPYDMVSQGLFGGLIGGRGLRRAMEGKSLKRNIGANAVLGTAEAANEGTQEHFQTQAVEYALDKPVGTFFEPTEEERKAFNAAFMGTLPMVFAGGVRNVAKNWVDGKIESMQSELKTARDTSAAQESAGEEERRVGSILDDAAPYIGVTMDNGTQGCVEAVTKVGAKSCSFLAQELDNGVVNVDDLVAHAGNNVIPFDPDSLEEGDVIVYGDGSDPHLHVVLYDGKGGYVGNSTEREKVVHETDYTAMGTSENGQPLVPTKIIKTGAQFGGTHAAPVMPDFTGLVADAENLAETQERIQHLIDTDGLTPEQHAAILEAAQMIRDMPVGDGTDPALEAEHVNEWQSLIDRKDVKGIFEKDPQRVVQTMTTLGKEQRAQKTRAAIENQQQIEETKQAINALRAQSIAQPVPTGRIDNTVQGLPGMGETAASVGGSDLGGGYDTAQGGMLMNAPLPPADNVPTQQSVQGRTIGTAAANLPMRNNPAQIVEQGTGGGLLTPGLQAYEEAQTGGTNPLRNPPPHPYGNHSNPPRHCRAGGDVCKCSGDFLTERNRNADAERSGRYPSGTPSRARRGCASERPDEATRQP